MDEKIAEKSMRGGYFIFLGIFFERKKRIMAAGEARPGAKVHWCFTMNNPGAELLDFDPERLKYLVYQREVGESGTEHYQGYVILKRRGRLNAVQGLWQRSSHWTEARSSPAVNKLYCTKEEGRLEGPWEFGTIAGSGSGARSDVAGLCEFLKTHSVAEAVDEYPVEAMKFGRGMQFFKQELAKRERGNDFVKPDILVMWGDSGVGKSRKAREIDPELYQVPVHEAGTTWFDGYNGQETILLDDFNGGILYTQMLRLCDGYPLQVQVKGGFTILQHKRIIITSNKAPELWYKKAVVGEAEALQRRLYGFGKVVYFRLIGEEVVETNYERQPVPEPILFV